MLIKVGRQEYRITSEDRFLDNGACVQLITQKGPFGKWHYKNIVLPKREIKRLAKLKRIERPHKYGQGISVFSIEL